MKLTRILVISSALLILPIVGCAQQMPDAATTNKSPIENLQRVVTAQTAAIQKLNEKIAALEARVTQLENAKPAKPQ